MRIKPVCYLFCAGAYLLAGGTLFAQTQVAPSVTYPSGFAISPPISAIEDPGTEPGDREAPRPKQIPNRGSSMNPAAVDRVAQTAANSYFGHIVGSRFPGAGANGYAPSDANLAVGPNHIFQTVNVRYQIFDKAGTSLAGPNTLGSLWTSLTATPNCAGNGGDPVVQYDRAADRWLISQLGFPTNSDSSYYECIAVSTSPDPTRSYALYAYSFSGNLNDYPKIGVWPTTTNSAYLATYNIFRNGQTGVGADLCAYDRAAMVGGNSSAKQICFQLSNDYSYLPSDVDGPTPPADGTPGYFMTLETTSTVRTYQLAPNFATGTGTLTQVLPDLPVAGFAEACGGGICIPQSGTNQQLDSLADRPMYRLPYRVFSDHAVLLMNHSVNPGTGVSAPRWYEFRQTPVSATGAFSVNQQGTYAPDSTSRWMGSIAMDQSQDIAIGYSASSSSLHPAIRYTGRVPTDPAGTLQAESSLVEGTGSQTSGLSRWGDYSALRIDPSDDCTFWYTNQYEASSGTFNWSTAIGSFKLPNCGAPPNPDFSISANPASSTVVQGNRASSTVSVTSLNSYSKLVSLSYIGTCPTAATCGFSANSVTPPANSTATSTFSVATAGTTPTGTYNFTLQGSDGTLTHSTPYSVTINAPSPDFSIGVSPTLLVVKRSSSGSTTVTVTAIGGSSSVRLSASGLPSKATASFSSNPVITTGTSRLTITANRRTPTGNFTITVTGTNNVHTETMTFTLTVQ